MLLHKFQNEFAPKGLNKCLSIDKSCFGFPNMYFKSNISQPVGNKPISSDTIRSKPIRSQPIRGSAYHPLTPFALLHGKRLGQTDGVSKNQVLFHDIFFIVLNDIVRTDSQECELGVSFLENEISSHGIMTTTWNRKRFTHMVADSSISLLQGSFPCHLFDCSLKFLVRVGDNLINCFLEEPRSLVWVPVGKSSLYTGIPHHHVTDLGDIVWFSIFLRLLLLL